jgi:hypothetical protein
MEGILEGLVYCIVLISVIFFPGLVLTWLLFPKKLEALEQLFLSSVLGLSVATFLGIAFDIFGISLGLVELGVVYTLLAIFFVYILRKRLPRKSQKDFSSQIPLAFLSLFLILLILKAFYLGVNTIPISTDLGHHMYWSEYIVSSGELPEYGERDIIMAETSNGEHSISEVRPISDVIVGEHVIFAVLALLSSTDIVSVYPMIFLFFVHSVTLLGVYLLTRRLFQFHKNKEAIAIVTLFIIGILFGIDSPQMRYITGGVVGNIFGNLFIVSLIFTFFMALVERSKRFMTLGVALVFALAYTHHLSTLLFTFSLVGVLMMLVIFKKKFFWEDLLPIVFSKQVLSTFVVGMASLFFLWPPAYIANSAVENVVGQEEQKAEHAGITLNDYLFALGEERMLLAFLGLGMLVIFNGRFLSKKKETAWILPSIVLFGWLGPLFILVFVPQLVQIDIPTIRTANYTIIPMSIVGGLFFVWLVDCMRRQVFFSATFFIGLFFLFFLGLNFSGWYDNAYFMKGSDQSSAKELHRVAKYVGNQYRNSEDVVMYDHININGGSWMKLYFMRDYNYPFYRALLFRYDRTTDKQEYCTRDVFTYPGTSEAQKCFEDLSVRALVMNEAEDGKFFRESEDFSRIYAGREIVIYKR